MTNLEILLMSYLVTVFISFSVIAYWIYGEGKLIVSDIVYILFIVIAPLFLIIHVTSWFDDNKDKTICRWRK